MKQPVLDWWFHFFKLFTPNLGEMIQFDEHLFQMGWFNHQLVMEYQAVSPGWLSKVLVAAEVVGGLIRRGLQMLHAHQVGGGGEGDVFMCFQGDDINTYRIIQIYRYMVYEM